jgi:hypothetical protein
MTCGGQRWLSDRNPQHLNGQAPEERFALQPRSRALWQPRLPALARRVGMGVDARSQKQRRLAVPSCCGLQWKRVRLAIMSTLRPTIIDSRRGLRLTLIAIRPTLLRRSPHDLQRTCRGTSRVIRRVFRALTVRYRRGERGKSSQTRRISVFIRRVAGSRPGRTE